MQPVTIPRRRVLGWGVAVLGSLLAGCSRAVSGVRATTAPPTPSPPTTTSPSVTPSPSHAPARPVAHPKTHHGPAVEFARGPVTRREVALTFHGSGDLAIARELLAIFKTHRAHVTVMAVGTWLETYPDVAREIVAAGHELGNHTYSHIDIESLDAAGARAEIVRCRDLLHSIVGTGGQHFRPSQAQHATPLIRQLAGAAGYPVCLSYDVDSLDYTDPGADAVRQNVAAAGPGSIVSLHFGHPGTVEAMPLILSDLAARGLKPVTATRLLRP